MGEVTRRGPNKRRAETTRRELAGTARDLFLRDGDTATSPNDIAVACAMTRGVLYHHFRSKTEVLDAVVRPVQRELRTAVLREASTARDSCDDRELAGRGDSPERPSGQPRTGQRPEPEIWVLPRTSA